MSRPQLVHGSLTSLMAALTLLTTGCAQQADDVRGGADVCRADGGWSVRKRAAWLRPALSFPGGAADEDEAVVIGAHTGGPLCAPISVRVEFWAATVTTAGTDLKSVLRVRLTTDGSRPWTVGLPTSLAPEERGDCTGVLVAAYPGAPLTRAELPDLSTPLTPSSTTADTPFGTTRVAARHLLPPATACGTSGGTTPNPWGGDHP
ncbi:hypothetical protein SAMN04487980_106114 [Streptomyces sp. cf124]|uniref:hypothetical protein n=1 Tax=Streptomyces sp. cf124 TaxID=1761903 RepID=UPI0008EAD52B|nr:hypothetical protein [Streptomyces sp. cf124]SFO10345.1 hypothetical protein SAMN04487980_106114 [Streptomyces sp. cf124]